MSKQTHPFRKNTRRALFSLVALVFLLLPARAFGSGYENLTPYELQKLDILFSSGNETCKNNDATQGTFVATNDNEGDAFRYFLQKGLGPVQAAAIVGNLMGESHVNPTAQEDRSQDPFPHDGVGFGIAQWTSRGRQNGLIKLGDSKTPRPLLTELGLQLEYLWDELNGTPPASAQPGLNEIKATQDVDQATQIFMERFERPKSNNHPERQRFAREALQKYGGVAAPTGGSGATGSSSLCIGQTSSSEAVICNNGAASGSETLSATRKNVVCLAETEKDLWVSGQLKPGNDFYKYSQNNAQDWCADFVSWVYWKSAYPLRPEPGWRVAAVDEVASVGHQEQSFHYHSRAGYTPRPGDIIVHRKYDQNHVKIVSHVNIVVKVEGNTMTIIGGNQGGSFYTNSKVSEYKEAIDTTKDSIEAYVTPD